MWSKLKALATYGENHRKQNSIEVSDTKCKTYELQNPSRKFNSNKRPAKWVSQRYRLTKQNKKTWQVMLAADLATWNRLQWGIRAHKSIVQSADKDFSRRSFPHLSLFQPMEFADCRTANSQCKLCKWWQLFAARLQLPRPSHLNPMIWADLCFLKGTPQEFALCIERNDGSVHT